MKKIYAFILGGLFLGAVSTNVHAQVNNPSGAGLRVSPDGLGLNGKFFLSPYIAIEAQINGSMGFNNYRPATSDVPAKGSVTGSSWSAVGLVEYNYIFPNVSWRIFTGGGFHFGKWDRYDHASNEMAPKPQGIFGFDAILGVEYLFKSQPLGISAEVKPAINVVPDITFFPANMIGLSFRYYFGHRVLASGTSFIAAP